MRVSQEVVPRDAAPGPYGWCVCLAKTIRISGFVFSRPAAAEISQRLRHEWLPFRKADAGPNTSTVSVYMRARE